MANTHANRHSDTLRKFLPDFVHDADDGLITTFAIVAGVAGAGLSTTLVLILGFASLLADGFSMATSAYLSRRTPGKDESVTARPAAARHGLATFTGFVLPGSVRWWPTCCRSRTNTAFPLPRA